jgi:hypothetical protein
MEIRYIQTTVKWKQTQNMQAAVSSKMHVLTGMHCFLKVQYNIMFSNFDYRSLTQ